MVQATAPRPAERRYRVTGLAERDVLVIKSMIKLLAGKTRDHWTASDGDPVHALIAPVGYAEALPAQTAIVRVTLPLRADDLWSQLDRASAQIELDMELLRPANRVAEGGGGGGGRRLQLMRWPPDSLLGSDLRYLRLATMLGARPFAVEELAAKSGIPLATCHAFAAMLHGNGVAEWLIDPDHPDASAPSTGSGLIGRIRSRLGLP